MKSQELRAKSAGEVFTLVVSALCRAVATYWVTPDPAS